MTIDASMGATAPSGARLPRGNVTVEVSPRAFACSGPMMTASGSIRPSSKSTG